MTVEILPVSPQHVAKVWPLIDKYVVDALAYAQGVYLPSDIKGYCEGARMQLWIATRGDKVLAAVITEIMDFPRMRIVSVPFIGGTDLRSWFRKMLLTVEAWSKEMGCVGMQGGARRGWGKIAKMDEIGVMLWKRYEPTPALEIPASESKELH